MTETKIQRRDYTLGFNRFMYVAMILLSVYYLIFNNDVSSAMSNLGIGLIFDPFKQEVSWQRRPTGQKVVLLVHLSAVFVLLGILLFDRFFG